MQLLDALRSSTCTSPLLASFPTFHYHFPGTESSAFNHLLPPQSPHLGRGLGSASILQKHRDTAASLLHPSEALAMDA